MDNVNQPKHYQLEGLNGVEAKDVIHSILGEDVANFYIGNVIKYMLRYKNKNGIEDLKKARVYLNWAIEEMEKKEEIVVTMTGGEEFE